MPVDMKKKRRFFDPNPGLAFHGTVAPIPRAVKKVADQLNGTRQSLQKAVAAIKAASGEGIVIIESDCIILMSPRTPARHSWRVIRFK